MLSEQEYWWAPYRGAHFGWGRVMCLQDGKVSRVWLPEDLAGPTELNEPMSSVLRDFQPKDGGPATAIALLLEEAFEAGRDVSDIPVDLPPADLFFKRALVACRRIPHGETRSYSWLAAEAGSPKGSRAVGTAMASNRCPLVVPCHRVLQRSGSVGQYYGGAAMKRWLLEREGALAPS